MKRIHETKLIHSQTTLLTKALVATVLSVEDHGVVWDVLGTAISTAAKYGIHELIEECLLGYPGLIWQPGEGLYLFLAAIKHRQVKVYNLFYQMTRHVVFAGTNTFGEDNALHLAGRKASPHSLSTVTGAALQMQRELQWFKEVEKYVEPSYKEALNAQMKTPRMVFTDEHMDLVDKGEKWMKDTASSSMVVAALIVTVAFAAIFTAPGGNKDDGTPYFLRDSTFMLFAISDALALFASVTSVLTFLSMLTSRFAEEDFLYALPKRITIGLVSLFISIAAIMVTFCAAMVLVLRKELAWIAVPVGLVACVPVTFFVMLQFPLLVELVMSTYQLINFISLSLFITKQFQYVLKI
uniref:PGG domain-containing protein n=1 Tax=Kalanchoe fedtschenkoi TaxID=63787 RepID=A0A7N0T8C7_KALFE